MFVFGNMLFGLAQVLSAILWVYQWILIARAITSWVQASPRNPIVQFLYLVTEPPIRFVRRLLPMNLRYFPLDIAFMVVFLFVLFLQYGVVPSIVRIGMLMQ